MFEASKIEDADPEETREWLESIDSVLRVHGAERAHYLLERLIDYTRRSGAYLPFRPNTAYVNTISPNQEREYPGDRALEKRIWEYSSVLLSASFPWARDPSRSASACPAHSIPRLASWSTRPTSAGGICRSRR